MLDISRIYTSNNYGKFKIAEYISSVHVVIEFLATGTKKTVEAVCIRNGAVLDPYHTSIYGVGYIGIGKHRPRINNSNTRPYNIWHSMIARCYSTKTQDKQPTYKGCSVCDEWLNFQNYADWFEVNYIEGHHLDKDIKIKGNKVYSPDTCLFVTQKGNTIEARAKHYKFTNPEGAIIDVYNLSSFCRSNGLNRGAMGLVHSEKASHHRGWTKN